MLDIAPTVENLNEYKALAESTFARMDSDSLVARIWQGDHHVWSEDPSEITDRLGWLTLPEDMGGVISALNSFGSEVVEAGYERAVLLGMGGSSLGPEVLRRTLGSARGFPELTVLDSTLPSWVQPVSAAIDPAKTLFLVSSKSGTTIESNTLYSFFRQRVEETIGAAAAGRNFVAVTDPGTALEATGTREGFRRVFLNSPEVGGRYSVLSYFGLAPATLIGMELEHFIGRATAMQHNCAVTEARSNPGARLGAIMGSLALQGRDKLTLVTSPALDGFGLWVEQLLAESLGKSGKGIIPVAGEPELSVEHYSDDRLIVYLRLRGDDNAVCDSLFANLSVDHPTIQLELKDRSDLGAEFYRWEFATAVAGYIIGVHPFDQPNVQGAKDKTDLVLEQYTGTGRLPQVEAMQSLNGLMSLANPGDYLAILAYLPDDKDVRLGLARFRQRLTEKYGIPTTAGFGPRYLHSTGQLHKGGPNTGIFIQLTADHPEKIAIPGRPYSFGTLADAQSVGDLQALLELGRRAGRVHLGADPASGIMELADQI